MFLRVRNKKKINLRHLLQKRVSGRNPNNLKKMTKRRHR